jgi:uncharacterized protein YkwD
VKKIGILLIVATLATALTGCTGSYGSSHGDSYTLTVTSSDGGTVAAPGEGTFTYTEGRLVTLFAVPEDGYQFVNWTGDVAAIANVNGALTTVTANDNYSIQANFLAGSLPPAGINYTAADAEALIIMLINEQRQEYELGALGEDALLTSLAKEHSTSMVENGFFGHERYPGERPIDYDQPPGTARGENLAKIPTQDHIPGPYLSLQEVCEWAVSGWMDSPGHRANILEPRFDKTGVGVVFSAEGVITYLYITQIFEGPST